MMVLMCLCKITHGKSITFKVFAHHVQTVYVEVEIPSSCEIRLNIIYKFREDGGEANTMNWKDIRKECQT